MSVGPWYHAASDAALTASGFSDRLTPTRPEMGTKEMFSSLKPMDLRKGFTSLTMKSYRSLSQSIKSSLFTATQI